MSRRLPLRSDCAVQQPKQCHASWCCLPFPIAESSMAGTLSRTLGISHDQAAWMVTNWPGLAQQRPHTVRLALHGIAKLWQCSLKQAAAMMLREHQLLSTPPRAIVQRATVLASTLGFSIADTMRVTQRAPSLLFEEPQAVRARLCQASEVLQAPLSAVCHAASDSPWLLLATPQQLQQRVGELSRLLHRDAPDIHKHVLQHPHLLAVSAEGLKSKLQALSHTLKLKPDSARALVWANPAIIKFSTQRTEEFVAGLGRLIPHDRLQVMVFREPSLLSRSHATLVRNMRAMQQLFGLSTQHAVEMVVRRPSLLTRSPAQLRRSFLALSVWRFSQEEKLKLLLAHPVLLRLSPAEVHGRCRWLRGLMMANGYMHTALRRMPMKLLGVLLMHLPVAWSRLQYMVDSNQEPAMDIMAAVQSGQEDFLEAFPSYRRWLAWKCSTGVGGVCMRAFMCVCCVCVGCVCVHVSVCICPRTGGGWHGIGGCACVWLGACACVHACVRAVEGRG